MLLLFVIRIGNWILILGGFVPISLLFSLDIVRYYQGKNLEKNQFFTSKAIFDAEGNKVRPP